MRLPTLLVLSFTGALACSAGKDVSEPVGARPGVDGGAMPPAPGGDDGLEPPTSGLDAGELPGVPEPPDDAACVAIAAKAVPQKQPADIIFGIDSSPSMNQEVGFVRAQMNTFAKKILDGGVDVRVIMLAEYDQKLFGIQTNGLCIAPPLGSGTCPKDHNPPHYHRLTDPGFGPAPENGIRVGSTDVLNFFVQRWPVYSKLLRPDALLHYVVVTDDDATAIDSNGKTLAPNINSAEKFIAEIKSRDAAAAAKMRYSGIFCHTKCADAMAVGAVHMDLVTRTGGVAGDLCKQDFGPVFDELAKGVVREAKITCDWSIPAPPSGEKLDPARVNVRATMGDGSKTDLAKVASRAACGAGEGWYYDDPNAPRRVVPCPASCTRLQADPKASVDVLFGCKTVVR
jgi:hypothetical protein